MPRSAAFADRVRGSLVIARIVRDNETVRVGRGRSKLMGLFS